jgi:hypothetical protein
MHTVLSNAEEQLSKESTPDKVVRPSPEKTIFI